MWRSMRGAWSRLPSRSGPRGPRRPWWQRPLALVLAVPVLLALAWLAPGGFVGDPALSGTARVVDGDTLVVAGRTIRLEGIDAPEARQTCERDGHAWACGAQAAHELRLMVQGRAVTCRASDQDRYGRSLARCEAGGEDLGAALVRQGWAVAYARYSWRYLPEEWRARWQGLGLWAGRFQAPEDWRRAHTR